MKKRIKSDRAGATTIEYIFVSLMLFMAAILVIDIGIYFVNLNSVSNSAQNGARLAAVYGGAGETSISKEYGNKNPLESSAGSDAKRLASGKNLVEKSVINELAQNKSGITLNIIDVSCTPDKVSRVGERTSCAVTWNYKNLTPFTMLGSKVKDKSKTNLWGERVVNARAYTTKASAESEVLYER